MYVNDSGEVEYKVESRITVDGIEHKGDYGDGLGGDALGRYNLKVNPRPLDPHELSYIYFNGNEKQADGQFRDNRYEYNGEALEPYFGEDISPLENPTIQININGKFVEIDYDDAIEFFDLERATYDLGIATGFHDAVLTAREYSADGVANNFTGSLDAKYYIFAKTTVN